MAVTPSKPCGDGDPWGLLPHPGGMVGDGEPGRAPDTWRWASAATIARAAPSCPPPPTMRPPLASAASRRALPRAAAARPIGASGSRSWGWEWEGWAGEGGVWCGSEAGPGPRWDLVGGGCDPLCWVGLPLLLCVQVLADRGRRCRGALEGRAPCGAVTNVAQGRGEDRCPLMEGAGVEGGWGWGLGEALQAISGLL